MPQGAAAGLRELGFGEDWRAAYDHVKSKYVPPGEQPQLIKTLAQEAIDFLEDRSLLTIPPLAKGVADADDECGAKGTLFHGRGDFSFLSDGGDGA